MFHVFGAIAQFERRLIAERTRDGMNAARAKGSKPGRPALDQEKLSAGLMLVTGGMSPPQAAKQTGLGRSTVYREIQGSPLHSGEQRNRKSGLSASFWSKSVAGGCPMLGQDRDNDIARVQQDGSVLLCRELDEAQSPEQEKSFNGQQSVTNVMGIA